MNPSIQRKKATPLIVIALLIACPGLSPKAQAVNPPPDGGYPNENTAEGDGALQSLTTGSFNTAIGFQALYSNMMGFQNTANGGFALHANTMGNNNTATGFRALWRNTGSENTANGALQAGA